MHTRKQHVFDRFHTSSSWKYLGRTLKEGTFWALQKVELGSSDQKAEVPFVMALTCAGGGDGIQTAVILWWPFCDCTVTPGSSQYSISLVYNTKPAERNSHRAAEI